MSNKEKDPCKPFACRIQDCLKHNNFQESACVDFIEDMKACCMIWKDKSFVCDGFRSVYEKPVKVSEEEQKRK